MKTYDLKAVTQLMEEIVAEKGEDFVYQSMTGVEEGPACLYARLENGVAVPDCGVGHLFVKIGVPVEKLVYRHREDLYSVGSADRVCERLKGLGFSFTEEAKNFLFTFQSQQDCGYPWGVALHYAKRRYPTA